MLTTSRHQDGSILLEALISILIFAFGVLALFGMQSIAIKNTSQVNYRANAIYMANQIISQAQGDINHLADYSSMTSAKVTPWVAQVQAELPAGTGTIAVDTAASTMTVTVGWQAPGDPLSHQHKVMAYVAY